MKNHKGFALIEGLLILLIVGILVVVGGYVYITKKSSEKSLDRAASTEITAAGNAVKKETAEDPTKDWKPYSSAEGQFSLKYPASWVEPTNKELCSPQILERALYLGPDENNVLRCGSEFFGQIQIGSSEGDSRTEKDTDWFKTGYKDVVRKDIEINGVSGKRISAVATESSEGFSLAEGTMLVSYVFFTKGNTYTASYYQFKNSPNVLADFNTMVTKTLKFEP